jgi:uncharacterized protein YaaQ
MKMILAVMPTSISDQVSAELIKADYRVTKFASTAGFLSGGITTFMVIADRTKVEAALALIRTHAPASNPTDPAHASVTIYVIPVKDFERV